MSREFEPGLEEREKEKFNSRIFLAFFRHSEKEKEEPKLLTPRGRKLAVKKAKEFHPPEIPIEEIRQSMAFGSPKLRAQETAGFVLGGGLEEISGEENLEKLRKKIDKGRKLGTKIGTDKRLDFSFDKESELGKAYSAAFKNGELIKFLVERSDELARKTGDKETDAYSRNAARVAEIVLKYANIEKRWDQLVEEKDYQPTMERYLGSHSGVTECFLAKVIEKTRSVEERNKFIKALGNHSFGFIEGFSVEIVNPQGGNPEDPQITVRFQKKDEKDYIIFDFQETVNKDILKEIINERG